jgi:hypothetical protein
MFSPLSWLGLARGRQQPCAGPPSDKIKVGAPLADPPTSVAPFAAPDCTQCDCECRENQKDGYNIIHGRIRSAQCNS